LLSPTKTDFSGFDFTAPYPDIHPRQTHSKVVINAFLLVNFLLGAMVSTMHQPGVKVLSENMGSQNKNIGDNGNGSATCSEYSADRLTEEISGILSFN
jgi:hypothetical protein